MSLSGAVGVGGGGLERRDECVGVLLGRGPIGVSDEACRASAREEGLVIRVLLCAWKKRIVPGGGGVRSRAAGHEDDGD